MTTPLRLHWNSDGLARLTAYDRAQLEAGNDPGDDGTGRSFSFDDEIGTVYLSTPTDFADTPIGCWRSDADPLEAPASELESLRVTVTELRATVDRVMAQRDQILAERNALAAKLGIPIDNEAHADDLGDPREGE